jgi:hypothetical protein
MATLQPFPVAISVTPENPAPPGVRCADAGATIL